VLSMSIRGIGVVSFYDLSIGFRNCSDTVFMEGLLKKTKEEKKVSPIL